MRVRLSLWMLTCGPFGLLVCALAWWPFGPGHDFLPFMPWSLYAAGTLFGVRAPILWRLASQLRHPGFRSAAIWSGVAGALAFWPGTWWCLLPALSVIGRTEDAWKEVVASRADAGLAADPFSPEGARQRERLTAARELSAMYMRGCWTPEEEEELSRRVFPSHYETAGVHSTAPGQRTARRS